MIRWTVVVMLLAIAVAINFSIPDSPTWFRVVLSTTLGTIAGLAYNGTLDRKE